MLRKAFNMMTNGKLFLVASVSAALILIAAASEAKPMSQQSERQIVTSPPLLSGNFGSGLGGLTNLLPAILPVILILGAGAFILPAVGLLLFGGSGGFGGMLDGFSKKRSNGGIDHPLFSTEKLTELMQSLTKALEEASKDK